MATDLDKDLASTMTPEEIEAINAEPSPDEMLIMRKQVEADESEEDDDDEPEVEAKKEEAPAKAEAAEATAEIAEAVEDPAEFKPKYEAKLPEDFAEQVAAVNEEIKGLAQKFKSGELDFEQYNEALQGLNERRDELNTAKVKAEVFSEMNSQSAEQQWNFTVRAFTKQVAETDGLDYAKDTEKQADLDLFVKRLANDPKNEDKPGEWFLAEAHKRVMVLHGLTKAEAPTKIDPKEALKQAKAARKPGLDAIPKTLAQVPGGDGPGDMAAEFSDLDALDGLELETAIARMTPAQRERYSQAA